ncbi:MAG: oxidoreductase [Candidatus Bathyarchaeota archaeon B26-2]|nr:MAG: oxidoreductase [Candidatus Bathyarchaeota archaeon B26-2]
MERRRLGRTGQMSSVVAFGCAALGRVSQEEADAAIELALEHGVNHFDVAPSYGEAELRLRPWLKDHRDEIFLACKTTKRTKDEAAMELRRSMERLGVDQVDLYQFHGLDDPKDLEVAFGPGGALEAVLEARDEGLIRYIGITSHRPPTILEALRRFDLDTVLFPLNFVLRRHRCPENDYEPVLKIARERDLGTIVMKAFAKGPWPAEERRYRTWYEPFDTQREIDLCLWFALRHNVTTVTTPSDTRLIPLVIDAAERYRELSDEEVESLLESAAELKPLFPRT